MSSLSLYDRDLNIKGKKLTDKVNFINELYDNIIAIESMHIHKLHNNVQAWQDKFAGMDSDQIIPVKKSVIPTFSS